MENGGTKCVAIYGSALVLAGMLFWGGPGAADQTGPSSTASRSPAELYRSVSKSLCTVIATRADGGDAALGSGFVVSDDGDVATNAHVVMGRPLVSVKCDGVLADVIAVSRLSEKADVAQLNTRLAGIAPLPTASDGSPPPGTKVFVFGSPEGLEGTMSEGIVSAGRVRDGVHYLQITAPISQGSSGGPVVNDRGEVVGIATAMLRSGQNLNFAVSVSELVSIPMGRQPLSMLGRGVSAPVASTLPRSPVHPPIAECTPEEHRAGVCSPSVSDAPVLMVPSNFGLFRGYALGTLRACQELANRLASVVSTPDIGKYQFFKKGDAEYPHVRAEYRHVLREWLRLPESHLSLQYESVNIGLIGSKAFYGCSTTKKLVVAGYYWDGLGTSQFREIKGLLRAKYGAGQFRSAPDAYASEIIWDMKDGGRILLRTNGSNLDLSDDGVALLSGLGWSFVAYFYPETLDALRAALRQEASDSL